MTASPISENNCTVTLDGTATRCLKGSIELQTGIDHLPGETGSSRVQGVKPALRVGVSASLDLVLTRALVNVLGKANQRKSVALTVACGTGAGSIMTFSLPTCEIVAPTVPIPPNDAVVVSLSLRVRGNSGNDSFTLTAS